MHGCVHTQIIQVVHMAPTFLQTFLQIIFFRHHHTDGAYFGTGFPHMLFMVHPEYRPKRPANQFVPRLYGFKIHPLAYQIQQQAAANFKV